MKAILVIKLPEQTDIKNLFASYRVFDRTNKNHEVMKGAKSLRPMPQKNEIKNEEEFMNVCGWMFEVQTGMDIGWNACLEAITGETE